MNPLSTGTPLLLDGGCGTELQRRGADTRLPLWSATPLRDHPELVEAIHRDYVDAGARVVTTNTFRTNLRTMRGAGIPAEHWEDLTLRAVQLARKAAGTVAAVAGSIAPVEDCWEPELVPEDQVLLEEHGAMVTWLERAGVDVILIETMNTIREAVIATRLAVETGLPVWSSFSTIEGKLRSGEELSSALAAMKAEGVEAVLVNCAPVAEVHSVIPTLQRTGLPWGAYVNVGSPEGELGWTFQSGDLPEDMTGWAAQMMEAGAELVGGCCGTTPDHTRHMAHAFPIS